MSDLKNDKKCTISFVGSSTPSEKFELLKQEIIKVTEEINQETPWQNTEPEWWLHMMEVQMACR